MQLPLNSGVSTRLDAANGKELFRHDLAGPVLSTACVADGWVYIGSEDGNFYAFASA